MTQPKQASPKRRPQIPDQDRGQADRVDGRGHQDEDSRRGNEDASSRQDVQQDAPEDVHQDVWLTNFIGRLAGLVRNIGGKK
jgi:hypothetical protein